MSPSREAGVTITESHAVFRSSSQSVPQIAVILGRDVKDGFERIFLDRRIVPTQLSNGWSASGAITTILSRPSK